MALLKKSQTLKSGTRISEEAIPYGYTGRIGRTRSDLTIPMVRDLDTTGARSAAEVYGSQASLDKWYAKSQARPMTEPEYNEYMQNRQSPYGRMAIRPNRMANQGARRGMLPRLMIRRSYQDYLNVASGRSGSSSTSGPSRLGVGGGTRATGLGY